MTIDVLEIKSTELGKQVDFIGIVKKVYPIEPKVKVAVFECRSCMRIYEVTQNILKKTCQPTVCQECGGRSFKLLENESTFIDIEYIDVGKVNSIHTIKVCIINPSRVIDLDDVGEPIHVFGEVGIVNNKNKLELVVLCSEELPI